MKHLLCSQFGSQFAPVRPSVEEVLQGGKSVPVRGLRFVVLLKVSINYMYNESSGLGRVISVLVRLY